MHLLHQCSLRRRNKRNSNDKKIKKLTARTGQDNSRSIRHRPPSGRPTIVVNFVAMDLKDSMAGIDDGKYVIYKQEDLFSESFPVMKEIRRQGKLCDVTLKVIRFDPLYLFLVTFIKNAQFNVMLSMNRIRSRISHSRHTELFWPRQFHIFTQCLLTIWPRVASKKLQ